MIELRGSDLRQFLYCPRVVYFSHVVPVSRLETSRMRRGRVAEVEHLRLERRRKLVRYDLADGVRRYGVHVWSSTLGISGIIDEVIDAGEGPIPVEVKATDGRVAFGHRIQLAAYALCLEEMGNASVARGFVHVVPRQEVVEIPIDERLRAGVRDTLRRAREMIARGTTPPPADNPNKCDACELRCFCNDV